MELDGARVLVTGASSGIGAATARHLAERGATVAIVARRAERLAEVLDTCRQHAPESRSFVADLSDPSGAATLARRAWYELGHLDAVVNNAAIPMRRPVTDLTPEVIEQVMTVNFHSPVAICLAVLPAMLERDTGTVVNVASVGGRFGIVHEAAYCASKFALCGFTESMALDLWDTGVQVRLIVPGAFDTEIWDVPGNERAAYTGPLHDPVIAAQAIAGAIEGAGFEAYTPVDMQGIAELKTAQIDLFLAGTIDAMRPELDKLHAERAVRDDTPT